MAADPITSVLGTRAGVLRFPEEAAAYLLANPPLGSGSSSSSEDRPQNPFNNDTLATRKGVLSYPTEAAAYIAWLQS